MENPEIVFSKEQLYEKSGDGSTRQHPNRRRPYQSFKRKVEEDPTNPQYIQTVWGAGYRFKA